VPQLVKNTRHFLAPEGSRSFHRSCYMSLSWAGWTKPKSSHPVSQITF